MTLLSDRVHALASLLFLLSPISDLSLRFRVRRGRTETALSMAIEYTRRKLGRRGVLTLTLRPWRRSSNIDDRVVAVARPSPDLSVCVSISLVNSCLSRSKLV